MWVCNKCAYKFQRKRRHKLKGNSLGLVIIDSWLGWPKVALVILFSPRNHPRPIGNSWMCLLLCRKHNGGDRAARCGVLAKAGPSYIPTSRGKRYLPTKGANTASPPRASCATHCFLMGQLDVGKVDRLSWTLDWTKAVPVAWSSKRRGVEALSQSCAWPRLPGHADASAVTPCRPWLLPHYALLWRGDGHWRGPRTRGQSISGSRVQPAPQQALCASVFSACGLLQPVAVGAAVRAEALEHLLRAGEGPPVPHSVAWSFREKSLICSTGTSIGNKE